MFTWSRRSKQKFHSGGRGRGVPGAHKLKPMPLKISCAPALPPSSLKPQASCLLQPLIYRTINRDDLPQQTSIQMHANSCPTTNKIAIILVLAGRFAPGSRRRRSGLISNAPQADTAINSNFIRSPDAAIGLDHGSLCLIRTLEESQS